MSMSAHDKSFLYPGIHIPSHDVPFKVICFPNYRAFQVCSLSQNTSVWYVEKILILCKYLLMHSVVHR